MLQRLLSVEDLPAEVTRRTLDLNPKSQKDETTRSPYSSFDQAYCESIGGYVLSGIVLPRPPL